MSKFKRRKIRIRSIDDIEAALVTAEALPCDGSVEVIFQEYQYKRGLEQNSLYWHWMRSLSHETGYTQDELHDRFKKTYMLRIYLREPKTKEQQDWVGLYDMIKEDGTPEMRERALDTISTTIATMDQFDEYLRLIENFCLERGFHLPARSV